MKIKRMTINPKLLIVFGILTGLVVSNIDGLLLWHELLILGVVWLVIYGINRILNIRKI